MIIGPQISHQHFTAACFVINDENAESGVWFSDDFAVGLRSGYFLRERQPNDEGGALADGGFDLQLATMAFDNSINHRQPEAGALFAFGGKKRLETATSNGFSHAGAVVGDANNSAFLFNRCFKQHAAALRHRV